MLIKIILHDLIKFESLFHCKLIQYKILKFLIDKIYILNVGWYKFYKMYITNKKVDKKIQCWF